MCVWLQVVQREVETRAALEEAELKTLELERQRTQLQHQLARYQEEVDNVKRGGGGRKFWVNVCFCVRQRLFTRDPILLPLLNCCR